MRGADVALAVERANKRGRFCGAVDDVLPVLYILRELATGWKFWIGWGMGALISALEEYRASRCPPAPPEPVA